MTPVIVCGGKTGRPVVFGYVKTIPESGQACIIHKARMILYWPEVCVGLFGLAANGPKEGLRLTSVVDEVRDTARQVLSVSVEVAKQFDEWPVWEG